jgi:hypothetical protein
LRAKTRPLPSQSVICRSGSWATKASYTVRAILSRLSLASDVCVLILLTSPPVRLASDYYSDDCLRLLLPRCHGLQQSQRDWGWRLDRHKNEPPGSPRSRGLCRLLPQLVGSFDPGGGCRGMGMPPGSRLSIQNLSLSSHNVALRSGDPAWLPCVGPVKPLLCCGPEVPAVGKSYEQWQGDAPQRSLVFCG